MKACTKCGLEKMTPITPILKTIASDINAQNVSAKVGDGSIQTVEML